MEDAYRVGESIGLSVWCEDEAGPFQTVPYAGASWQAEGEPDRQPHEYVRNGPPNVYPSFTRRADRCGSKG